MTKKRFSLLLERRRITRRLTACLIVNRGTGALTANTLTAKPAEKHQEHGGDFFFSLMALSNAGMAGGWGGVGGVSLWLSLPPFTHIQECVGILNTSCHRED